MPRDVAVVVPWRGGCPHRDRALDHIRALYRQYHPDWPLCIGEHGEGPWCKAQALEGALRQTEAAVLVLADADVWTDQLEPAVRAIEHGAAWAVPHDLVHRLGADGEERERPYRGIEGGGIVVLRRDVLLDCPPDPRFLGWGQEDESFGVALTALYGPPWRGDADLLHFWHPPQPRVSRRRGSRESWGLRRRYFRAANDPDAMRALIGEHRAHSAPEPTVRDHPEPAVL